jgi:hypothetical protein
MAIAKRLRRDVKIARSLWGRTFSPLALDLAGDTEETSVVHCVGGFAAYRRPLVCHSFRIAENCDTEAMSGHSDPARSGVLRNHGFALCL